jgi:SH3 domain-containing YSC84-like protein 1
LHCRTADKVLDQALDPKQKGVPKELFKRAVGICLISVVEVGFLFSGSVGTGILLKRKAEGWSKPCAMGMAGVGWGLLAGGAVKDIMIFLLDPTSMKSMLGVSGLRVGGQLNLTPPGPYFGRNYDAGVGVSNKGAMGTVSVAFSQGILISVSVQGAVLGVRGGANDSFYGAATSPQSIMEDDTVSFPESRPTLIESVYEKLNKLVAVGETTNVVADDVAQQEVAKAVTQQEQEAVEPKKEDAEGI